MYNYKAEMISHKSNNYKFCPEQNNTKAQEKDERKNLYYA